MWQYGILVRLFVASLCAVAAANLTLMGVGNGAIAVVAGLCGFLMGDHVAAAFV